MPVGVIGLSIMFGACGTKEQQTAGVTAKDSIVSKQPDAQQPPRECKYYHLEFRNNEYQALSQPFQTETYDVRDSLIRRIETDETTGGMIRDHQFSFNDAGQLISRSTFLPGGKLQETTAFSYDEKGRLLHTQFRDEANMPSGSVAHVYDAQGYLILERKYNAADELLLTTYFGYDGKGRLSQSREQSPDSVFGKIENHIFDDQGNLVMESSYLGKTLVEKTKLIRDEKGRIKQRTVFDAQSIPTVFRYEWNPGGTETVETVENEKGEPVRRELHKYDATGRKQLWERNDLKLQKTTRTEYSYNSEGNPLQETDYDDKGKVRSRKIWKYNDRGKAVEVYISR